MQSESDSAPPSENLITATTVPQAPPGVAGDEDEPCVVETRTVGCDGGSGPLGHPLVFLRITRDNQVVCPYCSRRFVLKDGAEEEGGH
jgi:uncharacterized Zn-finger protein